MAAHLYNITPYKLHVTFKNGETGEPIQTVSERPCNSRCIEIPTADVLPSSTYLHVTVEATDYRVDEALSSSAGEAADASSGGYVTIKTASFYANCNHSWLVSDAEIRRQAEDSAPHIAQQYRDDERACTIGPDDASRRSKRDAIKQYDWTPVSTATLLYTDPEISATQTNFEFLERIYRAETRANVESQSAYSTAAGDLHAVCVFNDSPYCLDILIEDSTRSRRLWNDPKSSSSSTGGGRTVEFRTVAESVYIMISAVDDVGRRAKFVAFRALAGRSWIVSDFIVVQRTPGADAYVAEDYSKWCTEQHAAGFYTRKAYWWADDNADSKIPQTLRATVKSSDAAAAEVSNATRRRADEFLAGSNGDFSRMSTDERFLLTRMLHNVSFDYPSKESQLKLYVVGQSFEQESRLYEHVKGAEKQSGDSEYVFPTLCGYRRLHDVAKYRVEFKPASGLKNYHLCAVRGPSQLHAAVFVHYNVTFLTGSQLRLALNMSLDHATSVLVTEDCSIAEPPARPPGFGDSTSDFVLLVSVTTRSTAPIVRYWATRHKQNPPGLQRIADSACQQQ